MGVAAYLEEDGSDVIPHISFTSLDTSQCDSSLMTGSEELVSSSGSARWTFCIKRRLSVPLLIVAVMMMKEVRGPQGSARRSLRPTCVSRGNTRATHFARDWDLIATLCFTKLLKSTAMLSIVTAYNRF
jgi:hypothetical protein